MTEIVHVKAREILDSRGNPTVEAEVVLDSGVIGPRGGALGRQHRRARSRRAARRRQEALPGQGRAQGGEERQRRDRPRGGRPRRDWTRPPSTRQLIALDGTPNKSQAGRQRDPRGVDGRGARGGHRGGAARSTGTSAAPQARTLPVPMMNILNGGAHADTKVDVQEFMVLPWGAPSFARGAALGRRGVPRAQEDPQGQEARPPAWVTRAATRPTSRRNEEALKLIMEAIGAAGFKAGEQIAPVPRRRRQRVLRQGHQEVHLQGRRQARSTARA